MEFHEWMKAKGIAWPNLGVNRPAGAAWAVAGEMSMLHRQWLEEHASHQGPRLRKYIAYFDEAIGDYRWIEARPRRVGTENEPCPEGCVEETYHATGLFIKREDCELAEIFVKSSARKAFRDLLLKKLDQPE